MNNDTATFIDNNNNISLYNVAGYDGTICESSGTEYQRMSATNNKSVDDDTFNNNSTPDELTAPPLQYIFRYKFSESFIDELHVFSKVHQYDSRDDFKDAWNNWLENNHELVSNETKRLQNMNYVGDIIDKMFKSARYYFRKKSTEKKHPSERGLYVNLERELLYTMDEHIQRKLSNAEKMKPSECLKEFQEINAEYIKEKTAYLSKHGFDETMVENKIKKTYKNRYFMKNKK
jgi:hypothetical protein